MLKRVWSHKLILILVLAAFLRLFWLDRVPPALNWDEVSMGYTAYTVSETGMDEWGSRMPLLFRSYGEWKSAVYIYLLVPFIKILGLNAWAVRLPSALAGIVAVYLTYLLGKKLYNHQVGLWGALFLAISPWHLLLSRPAFEANVSLTLILAGLYFFLQNRYLWSAVFFGLAPHTYNSAKVVVPLLVLYLIWSTKLHKNLKQLVIFLFILALFATPLLIDMFSGRTQFRYSQVGVSTNQTALAEFVNYRQNPALPRLAGKLIFNKYTYSLHQFSSNWLTYLNPSFLLIEAGSHKQHHVPYFGVLYLAEFIFLLFGFRGLKRYSSSTKYLPLVIISLGIIPAALTRDQGHVLRSLLTLPGWQLLAGIGISTIKLPWRRIILFLLGIQALIFIVAYFFWYPKTFARDWQYGYKEVAEYMQKHESEYSQVVMTKWYGEGQLFLAFYNRWDPRWYIGANLPNLEYERQGKLWLDQLGQYSLGKYTFKYLDYANEVRTKDILYIGKADDFFENPTTVKTIYFPDGSVAFHLIAGDK